MRTFIKFCVTGAGGTGIHYALLYCLVHFSMAVPSTAAMVGSGCGAAFNYYVNRKLTFESNVSHGIALPRYLAMSALSMALSGAVVGVFQASGVPFMLGQICATAIFLLINFLISKRFIFGIKIQK